MSIEKSDRRCGKKINTSQQIETKYHFKISIALTHSVANTLQYIKISLQPTNVSIYFVPYFRMQTEFGSVLFFGLHSSREVLWRFPDGQEARKVSIYLQNIVVLNESKEAHPRARIVDLCGDSRTLLVVVESGNMLAFSWSAKVS